jgi:hypothetical protein
MPNNEEARILKRLNELAAVKPSAEATNAAMTRVRQELMQMNTRPNARSASLWRIVMRSHLAKLAIAAAIIAAISILATKSSSIKIATPAFGVEDIGNAMKQAERTHFVLKVEQSNLDAEATKKLGWETWASQNPPRTVEKHADGKIYCTEKDTGKTWTYDPTSKVITVSQGTPTDPRELSRSPFEQFTESLRQLEKQGAKIVYSHGDREGRPVTIIHVDFTPPQGGVHSILSVTVDSKTYLMQEMTWQQEDTAKGLKAVSSGTVDYPASVPTDVYEAGAPQDAKVVFLGQSSTSGTSALDGKGKVEVDAIVKLYNAARIQMPERWVLTLVTTDEDNSVCTTSTDYVNGLKERWERRSILPGRVPAESVPVSGGLAAIRRWGHDVQFFAGHEWLSDGSYKYQAQYDETPIRWLIHEKEKINPAYPHSGAYNIGTLGWPSISGALVEDANAAQRGLVRIEARDQAAVRDGKLSNPAEKRVYFLDPKHDYMCVRSETYSHVMPMGKPQPKLDEVDFEPSDIPSTPTRVREVLEFGRLADGRLYPAKFREVSVTWIPQGRQERLGRKTEITTVYLEVDPTFPPGVFDPNQFPEWKP